MRPNNARKNRSSTAAVFFLALTCALGLTTRGSRAATITVKPGQSIQSAVAKASSGDTIEVMPGTYNETVYIDKDNIRLSGVVVDGKWPVLDGEGRRNDGILAGGHGVSIEHMWVRRFKGNGIMTQGSNNFRIVNNVVEGPIFYAIFPQFGRNGLVANNRLSRSEDAAIYVGMSDAIEVTGNEASDSIIGIETENTRDALIHSNFVHDNVMGIAVTKLPGLPVKSAERTIIRDNFVIHNNTSNFAPAGAVTAAVPAGVGILLLGADDATVEDNVIRNNDTVGIFMAETTYVLATPDAQLDPLPHRNRILRNNFFENGANPRDAVKATLATAGRNTGVDVLSTGKGQDNCISERGSVTALGISRLAECPAGATSRAIVTVLSDQPVPSITYTAAQKGRLTYMAVCTGCHTYDARLVGPPMITIKALYANNAEGLADWIAKPTKKRPDLPEMPPQDYLPKEVRLGVANYILTELSH
jgi:parallel beta-helix repeat protein